MRVMRVGGLEVVGTDLVDAGSLLAAGVLLTLLHIAVTEPALQEQEPRISTQVASFRQGAVSHSAASSGEERGEVLSDTVQSPLL